MKKFIDLGLPSRTLWAEQNEEGYFFPDKATKKFGKNMPTGRNFNELIDKCKWTWDDTEHGYTVEGKNGNRIFLPAMGLANRNKKIFNLFNIGFFWTKGFSYLHFSKDFKCLVGSGWDIMASVRLIKKQTLWQRITKG